MQMSESGKVRQVVERKLGATMCVNRPVKRNPNE